eukprot:CAMPEP_0194550450 /NCGR_PEP_ID=MMETSP0253-20130528/95720_1 /TAXON_ID=2966 /ORGANISM="Noctiluca scintillans" /LENGTH=142 /DNA_ID=CAMNT_0039397889 /DNA_START=69 /DNA_END=497 /DNA_ORIENTATION=-
MTDIPSDLFDRLVEAAARADFGQHHLQQSEKGPRLIKRSDEIEDASTSCGSRTSDDTEFPAPAEQKQSWVWQGSTWAKAPVVVHVTPLELSHKGARDIPRVKSQPCPLLVHKSQGAPAVPRVIATGTVSRLCTCFEPQRAVK